ncbi:MAG: exonuclease SbcCD subunit D [Treponema sp.]
MRIAHISDLHLGKTLHGFSLTDDQSFILQQIVKILIENKIEVLLVAGDVFDKNVASIEALRLMRKFLNELVSAKIKVLVISGNHDSPERLTFGAEFMSDKGLYFSKDYDGKIEPLVFTDEFGPVNFYLLPFIKPSSVKQFFPEEQIENFDDALKVAVSNLKINSSERNIIVAHQNIMNAEHCDSEESIIGGLDAVSADVFCEFDYAALGHIHKMQKVKANVVYSGTPLKYSVSELTQDKVVPIIELNAKGKTVIDFVQLKPKRDIRQIRGTFDQIVKMSGGDTNNSEDFIDIILTDKNEVIDALYNLRSIYPNILQINYDNSFTNNDSKIDDIKETKIDRPLEMFEEFYKTRSGSELDDAQKEYMSALVNSIWETF